MLKKILNLSEQLTHARLSEVCESSGATVYSKVRLADILPIDNSGVSSIEYSFALRSHLDFVVANSETLPLFAVEFDGPTHTSIKQKERDSIKDRLCKKFELPLLRITSDYLTKNYRNTDLLSWLVDVYFMQEDFDRQQQAGTIPFDEVFDPLAIIVSDGKEGKFPYWLSAPLQVQLRKLQQQEKCSDPVCYHILGLDQNDNLYGLGWIHVTETLVVSATMSLKGQNFFVILMDLLDQLLVYELYEEVTKFLNGSIPGMSLDELKKRTANFKQRYRTISSLTRGSLEDY